MKRFVTLGAVALALLLASESRASIQDTSVGSWGDVYLAPVTWANNGASQNLANATPVQLSGAAGAGALELNIGLPGLAPGFYALDYTITLDPGYHFVDAQVGATLAGANSSATVTETATGLSLTSANGTTETTTSVAGLTSLKVIETITVSNGTVTDVADTFDIATNAVPEPASLLVWGVFGAGGIGVSLLRSRRRTA